MSDLYKMNFKTDMSEKEYLRDSNYSTEPGLESDVLAEQAKINSADAIVFIYPVFGLKLPLNLWDGLTVSGRMVSLMVIKL